MMDDDGRCMSVSVLQVSPLTISQPPRFFPTPGHNDVTEEMDVRPVVNERALPQRRGGSRGWSMISNGSGSGTTHGIVWPVGSENPWGTYNKWCLINVDHDISWLIMTAFTDGWSWLLMVQHDETCSMNRCESIFWALAKKNKTW